MENQTFPLEYCRRKGWIFDVRSVPMDREIGVDFSGMRLGAEHNPMDRHCAEHGMYAVENMTNLGAAAERPLTVYVFPMRFAGMTGLPCRVLAEA